MAQTLNYKLVAEDGGIPFVSRTSKNNGVSSYVRELTNVTPNPANSISVAGGGSVMESFLQKTAYYSGRDLYYLLPKVEMVDSVLLYYCACLRINKFRFNYGRQANRTLKTLLVPHLDDIPDYVGKIKLNQFSGLNESANDMELILDTTMWKWFEYDKLFDIERGRGPRKNELDGTGNIPFVTSSDQNNGWTGFTSSNAIHQGNTIGVNRNGSVAEAFYQPLPFCSTEDVHIFTPKFPINQYIAMFIATLIKKEKYRYNYGRKWGIARMEKSKIKLPVTSNNEPDWNFMENFIKSMKYSKNL